MNFKMRHERGFDSSKIRHCKGVTFPELMVVLVIISLFVIFAQVRFFGLLRKTTFKGQLNELVSSMQMASRAASESDRRYEVIIDLTEQSYMLREISSSDLSEVLEEEIIVENELSENCFVAYVEFDDEEYTNDGRAKFRVGHSGWQYGGKVVLLDEDDREYSILINRINRIVELKEGDVELLKPRNEDEMLY